MHQSIRLIQFAGLALALTAGGCGGDDSSNNGEPQGGSGNSAGQSGSGGRGGSGGEAGAGNQAGGGGDQAGAGGMNSPDAGSNGPMAFPADTELATLQAFIEAGMYNRDPWVAETEEARAQTPGSPHAKVRVWLNPKMVESLNAGKNGRRNPGADANPAPEPGSMAVKEFYGDSGQVEGVAAIARIEAEKNEDVVYFCFAENGQCVSDREPGTKEDPNYGTGQEATSHCRICHGGQIFTDPPE